MDIPLFGKGEVKGIFFFGDIIFMLLPNHIFFCLSPFSGLAMGNI
jgi:hypothetical protein